MHFAGVCRTRAREARFSGQCAYACTRIQLELSFLLHNSRRMRALARSGGRFRPMPKSFAVVDPHRAHAAYETKLVKKKGEVKAMTVVKKKPRRNRNNRMAAALLLLLLLRGRTVGRGVREGLRGSKLGIHPVRGRRG